MVPTGRSVRELVTGKTPPSAAGVPRRAADLVAAFYDNVTAAAEGCDVLVATGLLPAVAGVRSVAEKLGIRYVYASYQPVSLPSPHHPPMPRPGRPLPPDVTDNRVLWDRDAQDAQAVFGEAINTHRASIGLSPVDNVRDHVFTDQPWLATDPVLAPWQQPADLDVVQTGAWVLPDERPLPAELVAFLDAGTPPVYVGFGSVPMRDPEGVARAVIKAIRAQGRRAVVSRGWADLALIDDQDDCFVVGEANHQALFRRAAAVVHHGGAGTTTTATWAGTPQVVVPQGGDQPYFAGRVAALGIGAAHDGPTPTFESLSAALEEALTPETGARARAVADTFRTDGATVAAKLLLDAVSREGQSTLTVEQNDLTIRPITGRDELDLFSRLPYAFNEELADDLAAGRRRPEWMWVALRGDHLLARAAWWGRAGDDTPLLLDILDLDDSCAAFDRVDVGGRLLHTAMAKTLPAGTSPPDYSRLVPSNWRDSEATERAVKDRMTILERTGARLFVERLRLEWRPGTPVPEPSGRLAFRPVRDSEEILALMTLVLDGTLDAHSRRDLTRMPAREAALSQYEEELARYTSPRDWWRIAMLPGGDPVGFVIPARNDYNSIIAYLAVLPAHRGNGYIDEILAEGTRVLAEQKVPRIRASTDLSNTPMANAFQRAGYVNFERAINMTWN
jgi:vancomycin aglycone glucosyltransferase